MIRGGWLLLVFTGALSAGPAFAQDGAAVYARACVSCHEQGAVARAPSREVISALSVERILGALETGTMRTQGEALTPAERRAVATFLSTDRAAATTSTSARSCTSPGAALRPGPADWQSWGVSPANERYQRQSGITAAQVPNLKLRWASALRARTPRPPIPRSLAIESSWGAGRAACSRSASRTAVSSGCSKPTPASVPPSRLAPTAAAGQRVLR